MWCLWLLMHSGGDCGMVVEGSGSAGWWCWCWTIFGSTLLF